MGKQTQVAMSEVDELEFLKFLQGDADVQVIRAMAPTPEELFVDEFPPRSAGVGRQPRLWNKAFPFEPEFKQWGDSCTVNELRGLYYIGSNPGAPILEYSRKASFTDIHNQLLGRGRIYWNTDFAIRRGPAYDVQEFSRWYDRVVRWVRKVGTKVELAKSFHQYWLPDANQQRLAAP